MNAIVDFLFRARPYSRFDAMLLIAIAIFYGADKLSDWGWFFALLVVALLSVVIDSFL